MKGKETIIAFFSNLIAVVLGIVITFAVQGSIDRRQDRREVASALELVRNELTTNLEDIQEMSDYLRQEKGAATYFLENRTTLKDCPEDSVLLHGSLLFADAAITISQDALELLKNSSLFQKIGDKDLAMKITRAYDCCGAIAATMNRFVQDRSDRFDKAITPSSAGEITQGGGIDIRKFIRTPYGVYSLEWVAAQPDPSVFNDVSDVEAALAAIDAYLRK